MLPRRHRLTRPADYRSVLRSSRAGRGRPRRRAATDLVVLHAAPGVPTDPTRPPRVGFVVSRAVGNSVVRHRVVRLLRAVLAVRLGELPAGTDLVVRAQPAAATADHAALTAAVDQALARLVLVAPGEVAR